MLTLASICKDLYKQCCNRICGLPWKRVVQVKIRLEPFNLFSLKFELGNNSPVFNILCFALAYSGTPPYDHLGNMVTLSLRLRLFGRPAKRPYIFL